LSCSRAELTQTTTRLSSRQIWMSRDLLAESPAHSSRGEDKPRRRVVERPEDELNGEDEPQRREASQVGEAEARGGARKEKSAHIGCYTEMEPDPS
jgi:hypothetical protein